MFDCMEDCIHLRACRRVQAIGKKHRLLVPRYCTPDCTAYISGKSEAFILAESAMYMIRRSPSGYSSDDAVVDIDSECETLSEIIERKYSEKE